MRLFRDSFSGRYNSSYESRTHWGPTTKLSTARALAWLVLSTPGRCRHRHMEFKKRARCVAAWTWWGPDSLDPALQMLWSVCVSPENSEDEVPPPVPQLVTVFGDRAFKE